MHFASFIFLLWKWKEYFAAAFNFATATRNHFLEKAKTTSPSRGGKIYPLPKEIALWWEGDAAIGGKINVKLLQASGQLESLRATAASSSWPDDLGDA
jgi:hypothetical protein